MAGTPRKKTKPSKLARKSTKPWEPCAQHLDWYNKWSIDLKTYREIATEVGKSNSTVFAAVKRVHEYMKLQCIDVQMEYRMRHTHVLEFIASKSLAKFKRSEDPKDSSETRAALAEIRKIWGADAPAKSEIELTHSEEIPGLPQMGGSGSRANALKEAAGALLAAAKHQAELEGSPLSDG
jgi:hypothetical protein